MLVSPIKIKVFIQDNSKLIKAKQCPMEDLYVGNLKKTGKILVGLCPFHQEKTSSFVIYPQTNTWHCFGCGSSGDSVEFYMQKNNVDFRTALEELTK
jgi:DNA primase